MKGERNKKKYISACLAFATMARDVSNWKDDNDDMKYIVNTWRNVCGVELRR